MSAKPGALTLLSRLLRYPDQDYLRDLRSAPALIAGQCPEAAAPLGEFQRTVAGFSVERLEELFIRTFDLSPVCALEVGWHLYGDEYARGRFLVSVRSLLRKHGVPEACELPDHLSHVLPLVERMPIEEARNLAARALLPALEKMIESLDGKDNPYRNVLQAVGEAVRIRFANRPQEVRHV